MRRLPQFEDPNLLVGAATSDDAGIYRIDGKRALVQTVDFFTPIVDDPFTYGQIAAANSLSDVYAMGGRPITAMNVMGIPSDVVSAEVINAILRGGAAKVKEARCALVGGHTIRNPEPIYGLSVTGIVSLQNIITNGNARAGDLLVLTKPLGTGIVTTGIKRGIARAGIADRAVKTMATLNTVGAELAEAGLVRGGTDITGYGLLGHLASLCRASGVGAEVHASQLPVLGREVWDLIAAGCVPGGSKENLATAEALTDFGTASEGQKLLAADAQTSGGLLLCVPVLHLAKAMKMLAARKAPSVAVIGRIVRSRKPRIWMK